MDDLHDQIAVYLRRHNRRLLTPCPPSVALDVVRCRSCGQAIGEGADPGALGPLIAARRCFSCYLREIAA